MSKYLAVSVLIPCPSCSRHVRVGEPSCPFCSARFGEVHPALTSAAQARAHQPRLSRVAMYAMAVLLPNCVPEPAPQQAPSNGLSAHSNASSSPTSPATPAEENVGPSATSGTTATHIEVSSSSRQPVYGAPIRPLPNGAKAPCRCDPEDALCGCF